MRKLISVLLVAVMAVFAIWAFCPEWLPWEDITTGVDTYQAAQMIRAEMDGAPEEPTLQFRDERIDRGELFRSLEALWPYAFSLHTSIYEQNGMMTVGVGVENEAAQRQANTLAQGIAKQLISADMPLRERLRVLHDYVVRNCVYDVNTAEHESLKAGSGADAPFTAAGALVDGKAVCAGYSRAFMMLCGAAGIDALYISDEGMNHGWNAVRYYGETLYIDTTFDDPIPDRGDHVMSDYFLKTEEELLKTHTWDTAFYGKLIGRALPDNLGAAQRLYDLHLLPAPPRAAEVDAPLTAEARKLLEGCAGFSFAEEETLGGASEKVWQATLDGRITQKLLDAGVFDEVRARQVGIPENAVKNAEK